MIKCTTATFWVKREIPAPIVEDRGLIPMPGAKPYEMVEGVKYQRFVDSEALAIYQDSLGFDNEIEKPNEILVEAIKTGTTKEPKLLLKHTRFVSNGTDEVVNYETI